MIVLKLLQRESPAMRAFLLTVDCVGGVMRFEKA